MDEEMMEGEMKYDTGHPIHSGILDDKQLHEARAMFDGLCTELGIDNHSARDMAAGLMVTMFASGQRDIQHIRGALQRFASELPSGAAKCSSATSAAL